MLQAKPSTAILLSMKERININKPFVEFIGSIGLWRKTLCEPCTSNNEEEAKYG